jgi:Fur family transcriptional regulator, zinc uptake regulator
MTLHTAHDHEHEGSPRLTPGRKAVLEVLEGAGRPVGAYEMIDLLAVRTGKRPAPTQVYRALDFLVEQGLVHRLASRNAFLACGHAHGAAEPVAFLICDGCGHVDEATSPALAADVAGVARAKGFAPRAQIIEIAGRCAACVTNDAA